MSRLLHHKTYKKIYRHVPLACVDVVLIHGRRFLLGKRAERPARGEWFPPGGRILKNEVLRDAARRKLQEELGFSADVSRLRFLGVDETMFEDSSHGGSKHTINIVFALRVRRKPAIRHDRTQSEVAWFTAIEPGWHPYVRKILAWAGFTASKARRRSAARRRRRGSRGRRAARGSARA